jgi:TPR repeat protein
MKKAIATALLLSVFVAPMANAAPIDDAFAAINRGDNATAMEILTPLAQQGNALAQSNVAHLYKDGQGGVLQNYTEAVRWYRLAAQQGNFVAQESLGRMYIFGQGVPVNYVKAHMWINIAASHGPFGVHQVYAGDRNKLEVIMTPEQIVEAQEMARKCQASNFKQCD